MKKDILKHGISALMWLIFSLPTMAGPIDPPDEEDPIDPAPIDNWILLLVMIGIVLGAYLVFKYQKKSMI